MNALEKRMYHWVIISPEQHKTLQDCVAEEYRSHFPPGMRLPAGDILHHIDDASSFVDHVKYPRVLHPEWTKSLPVVGKLDWQREKPHHDHWQCAEGHTYDSCLCHTGGLVHWGQDESIYGCKSLPSSGWIIAGKNVLCPKSDGQGW